MSTQLLATLISTASLAAMLVNPAFTLLGFVGFSLAPLLERALVHHFSANHLNSLQEALRSIDTPPEPTLCPATKPTAYSLLAQQQRLCQAENNLQHREEGLRQREETMQATLAAVEKGQLSQRTQGLSANEEQFIPPQPLLQPQNEEGEEVQPQQQLRR